MTFVLRDIAGLLSAAGAAKGSEDAERWIAQATVQAVSVWDWAKLLAEMPESISFECRRDTAMRALGYAQQHRSTDLLLGVAAFQDQRLNDPSAARKTLEAAERMLIQWPSPPSWEGIPASPWAALAEAFRGWQRLGQLDEMRRAQHTVVERTSRFDVALRLADSAPGTAGFARAEQLARTASDWFALARRAFDKLDDKALSRHALDHAAEGADTAELKARIASAYAIWFEDDIAADRTGPRGLRPDQLRPRLRRLDDWDSSATDLFDWIRAQMTPELLTEIAKADYGEDAVLHYAELTRICRTGLAPVEDAFHPFEVLRLTRWSRDPQVEGEHLKRAFSCILLYISLLGEEDPADIGPQMIASCRALGEDASAAAESFLVWLYETSDRFGSEPLLIPLLLLLLLRAERDPGDRRLADLLRTMEYPGANGLREWIAASMLIGSWAQLIEAHLMPLHTSRPELSPLLNAIGFPQNGSDA